MTLPSVTAILQAVGLGGDFSRVPAAALEVARARGSAVHAAIEGHHYGYGTDLEDRWKPYLAGYERFLLETGHKPTLSEFAVESARWRYCGHPDRVGMTLGHRCLYDWKTSDILELKPVSYQLAAYEQAWNEQHPTQPIHACYAVQLKRDGTYRLHPINTKAVLHVFQAATIVIHARGDVRDDREQDRYLD
jgi:hypothetical protein